MDDLVRIMDERAPKPGRPKTYKKQISNWGTTPNQLVSGGANSVGSTICGPLVNKGRR